MNARLSPPRRPLQMLAVVGSLFCGDATLDAHEYPSIVEVVTNQTVKFSVRDAGTCAAYVSATPDDPSKISISPANGFGVEVDFTLTAGSTLGTTTATIQWIGADKFAGNPNGPCQEDTTPAGRPMTVKIVPMPKPTSSDNNRSSRVAGDPVNTFNGELHFLEPPDLNLGGPLPLVFRRYYASQLNQGFVTGDLGDNWRHNFEWEMHWSGNTATVITPLGRVIRFQDAGTNQWTALDALDTPYQLHQIGGEMFLGDPVEGRIYKFDATGRLEEISDSKGNALTLYYDGFSGYSPGKLTAVSGGYRWLYLYYTGDKLTTIYDGTFLRSVTFSYTSNNLTYFTDANGRATQYVYDNTNAISGLLQAKIMPEGNIPWTQTYDAIGRVAAQTDAYGNVTRFAYGPAGTTVVTEPGGRTYTHTYDTNGSLLSIVDQAGHTRSFGNDGHRRRTSIPNLEGGAISRSYDPASGNLAAEINEAGDETSYIYTPRTVTNGITFYDVATVTHPNEATETFSCDSWGNVTSRVDQAGNTWRRTYNTNGQPLVLTNPEGGHTTNAYDFYFNLQNTRDNAGNLTTFSHDSFQRLAQIYWADGTYRAFTYDNLDRRTSIRDERGYTNVFIYDRNGNLRTNIYQGTNQIVYVYDAMDRLVSVTDAQGHVSRMGYDTLQRLAAVTNRVGGVQTNEYDAVGRMVSVTDETGRKWRFDYNPEGWLTAETDPLTNATALVYDAAGRLILKRSPLGNETRFAYNPLGLVSSVRSPAGRDSASDYDARGLLASVTVGDGLMTSGFARNTIGQVTNVVDANGQNWRYNYDPQGRLTAKADPLGNTTSYQYNNRNRVSRITFPGSLGTMDVIYDGVGNVLERSFSDGLVRDFTYDANSLCTAANGVSLAYDSRKAMIACNGLTIGRDAEGRIQSITFAAGKTVTYTYDVRGLIHSVSDWAGGGVQFNYDAAGRLVSLTRANGVTTTFGYDGERRVVSIQDGNVSTNLLTRNGDGMVVAATRNTPLAASLSTLTNRFGYDAAAQATNFVYDAMGRLAAGAGRTFPWNLASRVTSYTEGATTVNFTYDGFGNVLSRDARAYVWNYAFSLPAISAVRSGGNDLRYYVHDPDGRLLYSIEAADNSRRYYHFDEAGNTICLTSDAGLVTDAYACTPFGVLAGASGSSDNPFAFQGRFGVMREGSSGLYLTRQRIYDSTTKRFLSRDPVDDTLHPARINSYQYALDNPLAFMDPTGEEPASGTDYSGFAGNYVGNVGTVLSGPADDLAGIAAKGSGAAKLGDAAGVAGAVIGDVTEVVKVSDHMDEIGKKWDEENQRLWNTFNNQMAAVRQSQKKGQINFDQYLDFLHQYKQELDEGLDRAKSQFNVDSVSVGAIATLNLLTGLVPFAGTFVDWGDYIQYK